MRIKSVRLTKYKRFDSLTLTNIPESARLVVLLGPNGCGKSSVFDAFLVKSRAQRNNYALQGQYADYYQKESSSETSLGSIAEVARGIDIAFHGEEPARDEWSSVFYIRTAYRNEADFQLETLGRVPPSVETSRFARIIDPDQAVSDNYRRLSWRRMADLDRDAPGTTTFEQYRQESLRELQDAMAKLFAYPPLALQDFGGIQTTGVFRFAKGTASDFHYKNLSAGEKAAFDLLLDMFVKRSEYPDAIYCIDEPEAHTATALHGRLLEVMLGMTPPESQLWIATHSIGFVRKAYDLMRQHGDVAFIDFSEHNLDQEVEIRPSVPSRPFWRRAYQVALDDLADLITPEHIVVCEGASTKADKGFDAACYNDLFAEAHPDTLFVSHGNANEVVMSEPLIAVLRAVLRGATISRVIDRDEMTDNAREQKMATGLRVLRRRELENYLYDPDVLKTFLSNDEKATAIDSVLAKQSQLLEEVPVATADMKKVSQELLAVITRNEGDGGEGPSASFPVTVSVTSPDGSEVTADNLGSGERREIPYSARVDDSGIDSPFLFCLSRKPTTHDAWKELQAALPKRYDTWAVTENIADLRFEIECGIKRWMALHGITEHRISWYSGWVTYNYDVTPSATELGDFGKVVYERWFRKGRRYSGQQEYRQAWTISSPQIEKFPDAMEVELTRTGLSLFRPWSPPTQ